MTAGNDAHISLMTAAKVVGVSPRTVRYWITQGQVAAVKGQRGYLVRLEDVRQRAIFAGKGDDIAAGSAGQSADPAALPGQVSSTAGQLPEQLAALHELWLRQLE